MKIACKTMEIARLISMDFWKISQYQQPNRLDYMIYIDKNRSKRRKQQQQVSAKSMKINYIISAPIHLFPRSNS